MKRGKWNRRAHVVVVRPPVEEQAALAPHPVETAPRQDSGADRAPANVEPRVVDLQFPETD